MTRVINEIPDRVDLQYAAELRRSEAQVVVKLDNTGTERLWAVYRRGHEQEEPLLITDALWLREVNSLATTGDLNNPEFIGLFGGIGGPNTLQAICDSESLELQVCEAGLQYVDSPHGLADSVGMLVLLNEDIWDVSGTTAFR